MYHVARRKLGTRKRCRRLAFSVERGSLRRNAVSLGELTFACKCSPAPITPASIIMAGTFVGMMGVSLLGLLQIGYAVAFRVLLDTFVIRTTLIPAIIVLVAAGAGGLAGVREANRSPSPSQKANRHPSWNHTFRRRKAGRIVPFFDPIASILNKAHCFGYLRSGF